MRGQCPLLPKLFDVRFIKGNFITAVRANPLLVTIGTIKSNLIFQSCWHEIVQSLLPEILTSKTDVFSTAGAQVVVTV